MGFLLNPWVLLGIGVALAFSHGAVWIRATNVTNDHWQAKIAVVKDQVREEEKKRNDEIAAKLMKLVKQQQLQKEAAETEAKELRDAIAADQTDTTVRVPADLDRVFRKSLGLQGDVHN